MARKPKRHIPQSADELTAAWFTAALAGSSGGATVTAVDHERLGEGIGFLGDLVRCSLTWSDNAETLPSSVVAKLPSSISANRALGEGLMAYEREIIVYRDLADSMGIPMPQYFHSDLDKHPAPWINDVVRWLMDHLPVRGVAWMIDRLLKMPESAMRRFVLIMEDIDDARPAHQFAGGTLDDAYPALVLLAKFHAHHWMNQALLDEEPLIWGLNRTPKVFKATYQNNRDDFIERFGEMFEPEVLAKMDSVQDDLGAMVDRLVEPPWTILHGDYRLDNILFRDGGDIVVLDYQLLLCGRPGWDVAYFITTALDSEHRAEEENMLTIYHDALAGEGISDYSLEQLRTDAAVTKAILAHRMIGGANTIETQIEGRDESFLDVMVRRVTGWVDA
jgi:hypothetical protein